MKIHEYQAKALLREFGVAVPKGDVADTPAQARAIAQRLSGKVVVKAQVHAGGRGKAGGIKLADDPAAAEQAAGQILGMMLKTPQTPPEGIKVRKVLVEEASAIDRELYLSITLDRARATHVVMASQAGGMEIEEVAAKTPDKILREWAHPALGVQDFQARRLAFGLGPAGEQFKQASAAAPPPSRWRMRSGSCRPIRASRRSSSTSSAASCAWIGWPRASSGP